MTLYAVDQVIADALLIANKMLEFAAYNPGGLFHLYADDLEWYAWPQGWSDTSYGFGGMAGQMMTSAQCVVVHFHNLDWWFVYHGGRFAYLVRQPDQAFIEGMRRWRLPGRSEATRWQLSRLGKNGVMDAV